MSYHSVDTDTNISMPLSKKETTLAESLFGFFSRKEAWEAVLPFLDPSREAPISLRLLDYFVVTYAHVHDTHYTIVDPETGNQMPFFVYSQYHAQLKRYTKSQFDPFCRGPKFTYRGHQTNLRQLNFFRWALTHHVIDYAVAHLDEIGAAHKEDLALQGHKRRRGVLHPTYVRCYLCGPDQRITLEFETTRSMPTFAPNTSPLPPPECPAKTAAAFPWDRCQTA